MLERDRTEPLERCELAGCAVTGGVPHTCVCWGRRLCYPHFATYAAWAETAGVINRAPTEPEWTAFTAQVRARKPAEEAA